MIMMVVAGDLERSRRRRKRCSDYITTTSTFSSSSSFLLLLLDDLPLVALLLFFFFFLLFWPLVSSTSTFASRRVTNSGCDCVYYGGLDFEEDEEIATSTVEELFSVANSNISCSNCAFRGTSPLHITMNQLQYPVFWVSFVNCTFAQTPVILDQIPNEPQSLPDVRFDVTFDGCTFYGGISNFSSSTTQDVTSSSPTPLPAISFSAYRGLFSLIVNNCSFSDNSNGAIEVSNPDYTLHYPGQAFGKVLIQDSLFQRNDLTTVVTLFGADSNLKASILRCQFLDNHLVNDNGFGGVISAGVESLQIEECEFRRNRGTKGACLLLDKSPALVVGTLFELNEASELGGVIYVQSSPDLLMINCTLRDNSASIQGGTICATNSNLTFSGCLFDGNNAFQGGAIYMSSPYMFDPISRAVFANETMFLNNIAEPLVSGAVHAENAFVSIVDGSFLGNHTFFFIQNTDLEAVRCSFDGDNQQVLSFSQSP